MPWQEDKPVFERRFEFVKLHQSGRYTMTDLCEQFGVCRNNAYKWLKRYREEGVEGLRDRPKGARTHPNRTDPRAAELLIEERRRRPTWGAKKLLAVLKRDYPDIRWPAPSTAFAILNRAGLVQSRQRRRKHPHPGKPFVESDRPNSVWAADYKGNFRLGNGRWCYPLTITDNYTRFLIACDAMSSTKAELAIPAFRRAFEEFGLPEAILTDNGSPFASVGLCGLTALNIWFLRLGIRHLRIQPGRPDQNGRHERMHRTLKAEATIPAKQTLKQQQKEFDRFFDVYNFERLHEALAMAAPADVYYKSPRALPARLPMIRYPKHFIARLVSGSGTIRWSSAQVFISRPLANQYVGLEEVDDGLWDMYFGTSRIGRLDERTMSVL